MIQLPENLFSISCNIHCLDDKIIKETGNLGDKLTSQCMDVSVLFRVYFRQVSLNFKFISTLYLRFHFMYLPYCSFWYVPFINQDLLHVSFVLGTHLSWFLPFLLGLGYQVHIPSSHVWKGLADSQMDYDILYYPYQNFSSFWHQNHLFFQSLIWKRQRFFTTPQKDVLQMAWHPFCVETRGSPEPALLTCSFKSRFSEEFFLLFISHMVLS